MSSAPAQRITGTMLRDLVVCERRAWHDVHADAADREEVGGFVRMLWAQGVRHEAEVLGRLEGNVVDLRGMPAADRPAATLAAIGDAAAEHILGAEIAHGRLLGRPDILSRIAGRWTAGDVKSGSAFMPDGMRCREEYLAQVGLYALVLERTRLGDGDHAFVIGPDGSTTMFEMDAAWSAGSSSRDRVRSLVDEAELILTGAADTRAAASAQCGLCHWRTTCKAELEAADDLTLIAEVGRAARRVIQTVAATRTALAALDVSAVKREDGRPGLPGLGATRLARFAERARLQLTPGASAYARVPLDRSRAPRELHFDIEADPTSGPPGGYVYLHGVWERRLGSDGLDEGEFHHFFAEGPDGERAAFAGAWELLTCDPAAMIYFYSPYERTMYRVLQRRYPDVCAAEAVEAFFASARVIDLYTAVVRPSTEWPLASYGLKPLAKHLGFSWAATDASGASSIAWYVEWLETGDPAVRDTIIDYTRSDCMAQPVVLDAPIALPVVPPGSEVGSSPIVPATPEAAERPDVTP